MGGAKQKFMNPEENPEVFVLPSVFAVSTLPPVINTAPKEEVKEEKLVPLGEGFQDGKFVIVLEEKRPAPRWAPPPVMPPLVPLKVHVPKADTLPYEGADLEVVRRYKSIIGYLRPVVDREGKDGYKIYFADKKVSPWPVMKRDMCVEALLNRWCILGN
jgi:hypothetical protein